LPFIIISHKNANEEADGTFGFGKVLGSIYSLMVFIIFLQKHY
jgi:hypothetical protein